MLIGEDFIFVHPVKTGGTTVKELIKKAVPGVKVDPYTHKTLAEYGDTNKEVIMTVRHPYERAMSFYQRIWRGNGWQGLINCCRSDKRIIPLWKYCENPDTVLRLESLEADIRISLPEVDGYEIPALNVHTEDKADIIGSIDQQQIDELNEIYAGDFEIFGYERPENPEHLKIIINSL